MGRKWVSSSRMYWSRIRPCCFCFQFIILCFFSSLMQRPEHGELEIRDRIGCPITGKNSHVQKDCVPRTTHRRGSIASSNSNSSILIEWIGGVTMTTAHLTRTNSMRDNYLSTMRIAMAGNYGRYWYKFAFFCIFSMSYVYIEDILIHSYFRH